MIESNQTNSKKSGRGGARPGAGRKAGEMAKAKALIYERARQAGADGETPLEYMLKVMRESGDIKRTDAMAIAAAPYLHPRLAAIDHTGNLKVSHEDVLTKLEDAAKPDINDATHH